MTARILIIGLCAVITAGGVGAAIADDGDDQIESMDVIDVRKDDSLGDAELVDDEPDDDPTGDGDKTRGDDGTSWGHNDDHDSTAGDDGTSGGDNSEYVATAPAPAPAPVYDDYSDDGGVYSGT